MKADRERVKALLLDTVTLLCQTGLTYRRGLHIQGLLAVTLDEQDIFVVHINETVSTNRCAANWVGSADHCAAKKHRSANEWSSSRGSTNSLSAGLAASDLGAGTHAISCDSDSEGLGARERHSSSGGHGPPAMGRAGWGRLTDEGVTGDQLKGDLSGSECEAGGVSLGGKTGEEGDRGTRGPLTGDLQGHDLAADREHILSTNMRLGLDTDLGQALDAETVQELDMATGQALDAETVQALDMATVQALDAETVQALDIATVQALDGDSVQVLEATKVQGLDTDAVEVIQAEVKLTQGAVGVPQRGVEVNHGGVEVMEMSAKAIVRQMILHGKPTPSHPLAPLSSPFSHHPPYSNQLSPPSLGPTHCGGDSKGRGVKRAGEQLLNSSEEEEDSSDTVEGVPVRRECAAELKRRRRSLPELSYHPPGPFGGNWREGTQWGDGGREGAESPLDIKPFLVPGGLGSFAVDGWGVPGGAGSFAPASVFDDIYGRLVGSGGGSGPVGGARRHSALFSGYMEGGGGAMMPPGYLTHTQMSRGPQRDFFLGRGLGGMAGSGGGHSRLPRRPRDSEEKHFGCPFCGLSYYFKKHLKFHLRQKHSIQPGGGYGMQLGGQGLQAGGSGGHGLHPGPLGGHSLQPDSSGGQGMEGGGSNLQAGGPGGYSLRAGGPGGLNMQAGGPGGLNIVAGGSGGHNVSAGGLDIGPGSSGGQGMKGRGPWRGHPLDSGWLMVGGAGSRF